MRVRIAASVALGVAGTLSAGCFSIKIPPLPKMPRYAHYEVLSDPPGAHVFAQDGTYHGKTPTSITLSAPEPATLNYSLRVVKEGYREKTHSYRARCDKLSEASAKRTARQIMVILEREIEPAAFSIPILPAEDRTTLAVIDFDVGVDIPDDIGRAAADICREALAETARFKLMDRNNIKSILGEQDFAAVVRCDDTQCLAEYGRMLRVRSMVHGRISRLGTEHILHLGITNVDTSELLSQITTVVPGEFEQLREIVPRKTFELVARSLADK
ncbi:MAG: PEGA domain-containing protein [Planctomycetes bacterium]|nr:PEGA domain-containing protein [Planctomycetota bacterium]